MSFFGRIVDQDEKPVSGAVVHGLVYGASGNQARLVGKITATTDAAGAFEIDATGVRLNILTIKKPGYIFSGYRETNRSFVYAGAPQEEIFVPDKANPVVFTMRKKNDPAFLIQSKSILRFQPAQANPYILAAATVL